MPFLKYNAKAGRFFIRVEGSEQDQEIDKPCLVIDMANIKTGLIYFPMNGAPQTIWDAPGVEAFTTNPGQWKRGFKVDCYGNSPIGLREWSSNSINTNAALVKMHEAWETAPEHADYSKVPWFRNTGVLPIESSFGTNYEPLFELGGFTDRASRFPEGSGVVETQATPPIASTPPPQAAPTPSTAPSTAPAGGAISDLNDEVPFAPETR